MPVSPLEDKENQGGMWGGEAATGQKGGKPRIREEQTYLYRII